MQWRPFLLSQVNSMRDESWKVWEHPHDPDAKGLLALRVAEAARRQGPQAFDLLLIPLLEVRHVHKKDLDNSAEVFGAATKAGLDAERLQRDAQDPTVLQHIAGEHTTAVEKHGVFGTPTLLFQPSGAVAFLKMRPPPAKDESVRVFDMLCEFIVKRPNIAEVKRPQ